MKFKYFCIEKDKHNEKAAYGAEGMIFRHTIYSELIYKICEQLAQLNNKIQLVYSDEK